MDISEVAEEFDFVGSLTAERNEAGQIDLKMPQSRYDKSDVTPVHQYGWGPFCKFYVDTTEYQETAGIYVFTANHQIVYIGETVDIHGRIQAGYSNISPKNCFEGGQQTNCRINNLVLNVLRNRGQVALWATKTPDRKKREAELIRECEPPWNFESPSLTPSSQDITQADDTPDSDKSALNVTSADQQPSSSGKYAPLYSYLKNTEAMTVRLSFEEIEDILDASLPASARKYDVWWNPAGHPHAEGWAELGWTADPDIDRGVVTFEKIR